MPIPSSISDFVDTLQSSGRYAFTREEVADALALSATTLTKALQRLVHKHRIQPLRRGFFVIVPIEYSGTGMIPADWFIDDLMRFLELPYYVGVLSAASLHGAAHQQPQEYHIVVPRLERPIKRRNMAIRFFRYGAMETVQTERLKGYSGLLPVSTPAATAFDLTRFAVHIGGFDTVLTVLSELAEKMTAEGILAAARVETERAQVQRVGWLLERAGFSELTGPLAEWISSLHPTKVRLDPRKPSRGSRKDSRWQLVVNSEPEGEI